MTSLDNRYKTFEQFYKTTRAVQFKRYVQKTSQFSRRMQIGCDYYVYVCLDTFDVINPFTKKHEGRDYKSFFSPISSHQAKKMAFEYIVNKK